MTTVTGQDIPPDFAALYAALTSPAKVTQGPDGAIRLKKKKKQTKRPSQAEINLSAWKRLAEIVATDWLAATGNILTAQDLFDLIQSMIVGVYPTDYFQLCPIEQTTRLISLPTCTPDPDPPPYGYRTPLFLPTICDYPDGTTDTGPLSVYGEKETGYWHDRWIRWQREIFTADAFTHLNPYERMALLWDCTLTIAASSRGSRPMVSLNLKAQGAIAGAGACTSTTPPILKKTNFYWRFKVPHSDPPYYHSTQVRKISSPLSPIIRAQFVPLANRIVLNCSPRPMMGRGFNNNDDALITLDHTPVLYEVRSCMGKNLQAWTQATPALLPQWLCCTRSDTANKWVLAASNDASGNLQYSADGATWTQVYSGINAAFQAALYAQSLGLWVMVSNRANVQAAVTSTNGTTWTPRNMPSIRNWRCLAWSPTLGIMVAGAGDIGTNNIAYSTNGTTWTACTTPTGWRVNGVTWCDHLGLFVAVGNNNTGSTVYHSPDGINWTLAATPGGSGFGHVEYSPALKRFVATASSGSTTPIYTSDDGITWTPRAAAFTWFPGRPLWVPFLSAFIIPVQLWSLAAGAAGYVKTLDGINFEPVHLGALTQFYAIAYSKTQCKIVMPNIYPGSRSIWRTT